MQVRGPILPCRIPCIDLMYYAELKLAENARP